MKPETIGFAAGLTATLLFVGVSIRFGLFSRVALDAAIRYAETDSSYGALVTTAAPVLTASARDELASRIITPGIRLGFGV